MLFVAQLQKQQKTCTIDKEEMSGIHDVRADNAFSMITELLTRVDESLADVRSKQNELELQLVRLEESNKRMLDQLKQADKTNDRLNDLEKQVDQYVWLVRGMIAVLGAGGTFFGIYTQLQ